MRNEEFFRVPNFKQPIPNRATRHDLKRLGRVAFVIELKFMSPHHHLLRSVTDGDEIQPRRKTADVNLL